MPSLKRIENRIAEMKARGEPLRSDDNPEVLRQRLAAYRQLTAPLVAYYRKQNVLRTVNGMAPIPDVTAAIDKALPAEPSAPKPKPARNGARKATAKPRKPKTAGRSRKKIRKTAINPAQNRCGAQKRGAKIEKWGNRPPVSRSVHEFASRG